MVIPTRFERVTLRLGICYYHILTIILIYAHTPYTIDLM